MTMQYSKPSLKCSYFQNKILYSFFSFSMQKSKRNSLNLKRPILFYKHGRLNAKKNNSIRNCKIFKREQNQLC